MSQTRYFWHCCWWLRLMSKLDNDNCAKVHMMIIRWQEWQTRILYSITLTPILFKNITCVGIFLLPHDVIIWWSSYDRPAQLAGNPHQHMLCLSRHSWRDKNAVNQGFWSKTAFLQQKCIVCWFFGFHTCTTYYSLAAESNTNIHQYMNIFI